MHCEICNKYIMSESQYINGKYYHNACIEQLQKENQSLKKQLEDTNEELELVRCDLHNRTSERDCYYRNIEILENQQKEFIDYLENEIKRLEENDIYEPLQRMVLATNQHNLSKYKSIIGGKDETNNN